MEGIDILERIKKLGAKNDKAVKAVEKIKKVVKGAKGICYCD